MRMMMKLSLGMLLLPTVLASQTNQSTQPAPAAPPQMIRGGEIYEPSSLLLVSETHSHVILSAADFRALPHVTVKVRNGHSNSSETYSGVPLATLLNKVGAPLGAELRGPKMITCVVATGSDGYEVALSLAEVDPDFHANQIIVADAKDGQSLAKNGPYQLIVPDDKRPARWVHNLTSIAVEQPH
jgi:hypothetical protein